MRKLTFAHVNTKEQISCTVTVIDSTIPLLSKSRFSSLQYLLWLHSLVCVRPGQTQKTGFHVMMLIYPGYVEFPRVESKDGNEYQN